MSLIISSKTKKKKKNKDVDVADEQYFFCNELEFFIS